MKVAQCYLRSTEGMEQTSSSIRDPKEVDALYILPHTTKGAMYINKSPPPLSFTSELSDLRQRDGSLTSLY